VSKKKNAFNTVTPLSKAIAMALFISLPFIGFFLGMEYQKRITVIPVEYRQETFSLPTSPTPVLNPAIST
jgi:hypothetical protein